MKIHKCLDLEKRINQSCLWSVIPYAGTYCPPIPEEPTAGLWPMFFFTKDKYGNFRDKNDNRISFKIRRPDTSIDFKGTQLNIVQQTVKNVTNRQINIAKYWGEGPATKQFSPIIDRLIDTYGVTAPEAARILGVLQAALNDAFIITWHYKYLWEIARPNQLDQSLVTIICTPSHPSYPSGHATIAGCAEVVLSYFFPGESHRLNKLAEECAVSRLFGGVHFPVDNNEGLNLGRDIGSMVVNELKQQRTADNNSINGIYTRNLNAKLLPPPYKQAIPFNRNSKCDSLTIDI